MVRVVIRKINGKAGKRRKSTIAKTRVRDASGKVVRYFTIDANGPTFEEDLTHVYRSNVSKARIENKKLFGLPDRAGKFIRAR